MPVYKIFLSKKAEKFLDTLSDSIAEPIFKAIHKLEKNPHPQQSKKLKGRDGYRIRIGQYRVIYRVIDNELIVDVVAIGHRKDIYKF